MKYIQMVHIKNDDFEVATATAHEEIKQLGMSDWAKYDEMAVNGITTHFYKKPKRFSNLSFRGFQTMRNKQDNMCKIL